MHLNGENHLSNLTQKKRIEAGENGDKDRKAPHILMNISVFNKTMEKWTSKTKIYVTNNI